MALDPNIILHAGDALTKLPNYGDVMGQRDQIKLGQLALGEHVAAVRAEHEALARRKQVGAQYGAGDTAAAHKTALAGGDFELAKQLDGMDDATRQRAFDISQHTAPLLLSLKNVPPEQRAAAYQQIAPQLQAAGFSPEHVQQVAADLSDAALDRIGTSAMTIAEYQKAHEAFTLGQDQVRYDASGKEIARGPESIKAITTPEGGTTTIYGGAGHTGIGGSPGAAGARTHGYTPRARDGGDNPDNVVDNKIAALSKAVGVSPDVPMSPTQFKQFVSALPATEGASGNNPGGIKDGAYARAQPGYTGANGQYATFANTAAGAAAMTKLLTKNYYNRGQQSIRDIIEGKPSRGAATGPITIQGKPKQDDTPALSDQDIDYVAQQYMATGQMPPLGMGTKAAGLRARIIGQAALLSRQQGITGTEAAGIHADFKANQAALSTLQRNSNQVLAYERTANLNANEVLRTMGKGAGTTGVPVFNAWQQAGRRAVAGDPEVSRFNLAVQTFATEYARVVSGATGGAVTSDSARHEIMGLINNAQTPQQLSAAIDQARIEMGNRKKGLLDQADALRSQLGRRAQTQAPANQPQSQRAPPSAKGWGSATVVH